MMTIFRSKPLQAEEESHMTVGGQAQLSFADWMKEHQVRLEGVAEKYLPATDLYPAILHETMRYAVLDGGKRIRPLLVYAFGEISGAKPDNADRTSLAIECVHSYSLIHDDLPCMDNDFLRHGKPTVHAVYGEAIAMLGGDALQPFAFELLTEMDLPEYQKNKLILILAKASGSQGMCGGQAIDISVVGKTMTLEELRKMHSMKTGALICASVESGCWCGNIESLPKGFLDLSHEYAK
ncbi:MAG: polyprenyl synthetase family protein, partial [Burkholderiales bacterium]|nr:polyprenyl synthetase family protein [Burkholderiales bacterium]